MEGAGVRWEGCCGVFLFCFYEQTLKALRKARKYLLFLCSCSTGELWIPHPGSHQMKTGPQHHCSHTPAAGWVREKLLPKENLFLMPEQSLPINKSWQRVLEDWSTTHLSSKTFSHWGTLSTTTA